MVKFWNFRFILGILRDSETRKKEIKLRAELEAAAIADEIRLVLKPIKAKIMYHFYSFFLISTPKRHFSESNFKLERNEDDDYSNTCKISGKRIKQDFYLYPAGYICSVKAAPSPDVCPLTGQFLSVYKPKKTK